MNKVDHHRTLNGRKVTFMFLGAFATIITANAALIYAAIGSFPGLETRAPYIESLTFETRRIAQEDLDWTTQAIYRDGQIILTLKEPSGGTVVTPNISLHLGMATFDHLDQEVALEFNGKDYIGEITIVPGNWQVKIKAIALDGTEFSRTLSLDVRGA